MQKEPHHEQFNHSDRLKRSCCIHGLRQKDQETGCEIVGLTGSGVEIVEVARRPRLFLVLMEINMAISHRGVLMAPDIHFIQKFFSMKSLAVKLRDELEDIKNSTQELLSYS